MLSVLPSENARVTSMKKPTSFPRNNVVPQYFTKSFGIFRPIVKLEEPEALSRKGFSTLEKDHIDCTHLHDSYKPSLREAF